MLAPKHMPVLDGLRGLAILLVLLMHTAGGWSAALSIRQSVDAVPNLSLPSWLLRIASAGGHGVQLFFVVSAFTLTMRARDNRTGLAAYALRRLARVAPGYWLAGLAYTAMAGFGPRLWAPAGIGAADFVAAALFASSWRGGASLAVVPGGWSVSCEVAFYAVLPVMLRLCAYDARRAASLTGMAMIFAGVFLAFRTGDNPFTAVAQAPVFMCGITVALAAAQKSLPAAPMVALGILVAAVGILPLLPGISAFPSILLFSALTATAVALAVHSPSCLLANRPLVAIGRVSYSIYLIHFALLAPCLWLAERLAPADDWHTLALSYPLTLASSFAVASLTYRWIEQPAIAWAHRHQRSHSTPASALS